MTQAIVIDTRPESGTLFSPPPSCDDYRTWLLRRYFKFRGPQIELAGRKYYVSLGGVHQATAAALHGVRNGARLTIIGPHRDAAHTVLQQIGGNAS